MKILRTCLSGLAKLTSDSRSAIRKSSFDVLFNVLTDHGPLFSSQFWNAIYVSVILPIFNSISDKGEIQTGEECSISTTRSAQVEGSLWDSETSAVAAQCLVDLLVTFFDVVQCQLPGVLTVLSGLIKNPVQGIASTGVAAMVRLADNLGWRLSDDDWRQIFAGFKEATESTVSGFVKLLGTMDNVDLTGRLQSLADVEVYSDHVPNKDDLEDDSLQTAAYVISRMKSHIAVQLLVQQVLFFMLELHYNESIDCI